LCRPLRPVQLVAVGAAGRERAGRAGGGAGARGRRRRAARTPGAAGIEAVLVAARGIGGDAPAALEHLRAGRELLAPEGAPGLLADDAVHLQPLGLLVLADRGLGLGVEHATLPDLQTRLLQAVLEV